MIWAQPEKVWAFMQISGLDSSPAFSQKESISRNVYYLYQLAYD